MFSRTTGKAQRYLEPRIDEDSLDPWTSVEEMLQYLNTVFRDHFEKERSENEFFALQHSVGQSFHDFHTEFVRLAAVGQVPPVTWRSQLWQKLNRDFQTRLLAVEYLHPTYHDLVRECQRLSVNLELLYRKFPPVTQSQRRRLTTDMVRPRGIPTALQPGLRPTARLSNSLFYPRPYIGRKDSMILGLQTTPTPIDPSKGTCFNCSKTGHFTDSCLNSYSILRINKIKQEGNKTLSDNKATKEDNIDSEN